MKTGALLACATPGNNAAMILCSRHKSNCKVALVTVNQHNASEHIEKKKKKNHRPRLRHAAASSSSSSQKSVIQLFTVNILKFTKHKGSSRGLVNLFFHYGLHCLSLIQLLFSSWVTTRFLFFQKSDSPTITKWVKILRNWNESLNDYAIVCRKKFFFIKNSYSIVGILYNT